jgi:hypothetical protein
MRHMDDAGYDSDCFDCRIIRNGGKRYGKDFDSENKTWVTG